MKILFVSNLFPDQRSLGRGLDNANLLHALAKAHEVRVVAARPSLSLGGLSDTVARPEDAIFSPQYAKVPYIPKVGSRVNHILFAKGVERVIMPVVNTFKPDVVIASWVYPDGCALVRLQDRIGRPTLLIAQGTDIHTYIEDSARRKIIVDAVNRAAGIVTKGAHLLEAVKGAGAHPRLGQSLFNGIDLDVFFPGDCSESRARLGLPSDAAVILYVGNFLPVKNPGLALRCLADLREPVAGRPVELVMLGDGPEVKTIRETARREGLTERLHLIGRVPQTVVADYMRAADVLCLPSFNEGVPNVALQAFGCGLPTVASSVGGLPEIMTERFLGMMADPRQPPAFIEAVKALLEVPSDRDRIAAHGAKNSWERTAERYGRILQEITA